MLFHVKDKQYLRSYNIENFNSYAFSFIQFK